MMSKLRFNLMYKQKEKKNLGNKNNKFKLKQKKKPR